MLLLRFGCIMFVVMVQMNLSYAAGERKSGRRKIRIHGNAVQNEPKYPIGLVPFFYERKKRKLIAAIWLDLLMSLHFLFFFF